MTTKIISTVTTVMDEKRKVLSTRREETYVLTPGPNKIIQHKPSGQIYLCSVCVPQQRKLADYVEIDDPKVSK